MFSHAGVETETFQNNYVNTMAAEAPAPCIAKSSTTIVLDL